jgi:Cu+-exporting ATPase
MLRMMEAPPEQKHEMATDPVCGMTVDPATARHKYEHGGRTYYFCAPGCRSAFAADPERYLRQRA